jgi:hypothetical protein
VLGFCLDERSCGFDAAKTAKVAYELIVDRDKWARKSDLRNCHREKV